MKKFLFVLMSLFLFQMICYAKDIIEFDFPNDGWHKVPSPDGLEAKKSYVPYNQTAENYTEMPVFTEKALNNRDIAPMTILHKQLGKDRTNYPDIEPQYIKHDFNEAMVTWCSQKKNTCTVERAFQGNEGVILVIYTNKMPHYSQNMFAQWSNIIGSVKLYDKKDTPLPSNVIEL